ncbi:MAG TPA: hypothetical protein PLQ82_14510 [Desulfobacteraceae bacterium]|nr:hypothetical protein [Desulfobacteraceae bacterium]
MESIINFLGLFILIAGFIVGLGAVTVIDLHGFLGRKSSYWTEATTRTHKVTKPMIWFGIMMAVIGGSIFFRNEPFFGIPVYLIIIASILVLNGIFLSFRVSPYILQREKEGKAKELLPASWQNKITASFIVSFTGWWGALLLITWHITQ